MIIYPTLELRHGKCVSLPRGRLNEPSIWHVDPIETARGFTAAGAEWMHLIDIDAVSGEGDNSDLIEEIIRSVHIPVQIGGGFRSREGVETWIDKGAGRIVMGTMAAYDPQTFRALANEYPDQIVLAVDVFEGSVMTEGWRKKSALAPEQFLSAFEDVPLAGVIVSDIDADIEDSDASLGVITGLAAATRHPVIAGGTVRSVDDVARLRYVPNIAGTLIGRALFSKRVDLAEAIETGAAEQGRIAEFQ
ncbi:MAG: 1-(5-phosphoribosyl)-5-[(5-phosphoribosylamino)methylideneamino] imidazole-4-carboxamide isomerase [Pseudomonadota bacterium]